MDWIEIKPRWVMLWLAVLFVCCAAPLLGPAQAKSAQQQGMATEFPSTWDGRALRPLALSAVEQRFAAQFPGRLTRLTDGEQTLVWREVRSPTRLLHPATDCYRGLGYRIEAAQLEHDAQARLWRCFVAVRPTPSGLERIRVCERIVDAQGQAFTDTSSWFWAAQLGQSTGPWLAITTARAL
jgi:hypothetical protein